MTCACAAKIAGSFYVPVSSELQEIFLMAIGQIQGGGPWAYVESLMLSLWQWISASSTTPYGWWQKDPLTISNNIRLLILLMRLPAFVSDLAIAGVLYYAVGALFSKSISRAQLASLLWFLNPYTFFAIEALGVPDVATAFLTVLAALLIARGRVVLSGLVLAVGMGLKLYPILLLPAFLVFGMQKPSRRLVKILLAVLPFVGFIFYLQWLMPGGFSPAALVDYSSVTQSMRELFLHMPGAQLSLSTMALIALYFATYAAAGFAKPAINDLVIPILLVFLAFTDPYPQYYVWVLPFLVLDIALHRNKLRIGLLFAMMTFLFADWFIWSAGLLTPTGYSLLLVPLKGGNMPWYSAAISGFLKAPAVTSLLFALIQAGLYAITFIYALEIVRGWFNPSDSAINTDQARKEPSRGQL